MENGAGYNNCLGSCIAGSRKTFPLAIERCPLTSRGGRRQQPSMRRPRRPRAGGPEEARIRCGPCSAQRRGTAAVQVVGEVGRWGQSGEAAATLCMLCNAIPALASV